MDRYLGYVEEKLGNRIRNFLNMPGPPGTGESAEGVYEESLLSMEVKEYFSHFTEPEPVPEEGAEINSLLYQVCAAFELDDFEKMCLELAVMGEFNPCFEKFFIYMNNDWNAGYPGFDLAVRMYTAKWDTEPGFYRYFQEEGKLARYFFHICGAEGKSRVRWGFRCRRAFFSFLLSGRPSAGRLCGLTSWYGETEWGETAGSDWDMPLFRQLDSVLRLREGACLCGLKQQEAVLLLRKYARKRKEEVCFLDICRLAEMPWGEGGAEERTEICLDVAMQAVFRNTWICVHDLDKKFLEQEKNRQTALWLADFFQDQGISVLFVGEREILESLYPDMWVICADGRENTADIAVWKGVAAHYPLESGVVLDFFANTYTFRPLEVEQIFSRAERKRLLEERQEISKRDLRESCISQTKYQGSHLVTVVDTGFRFDDLVLPDLQKSQLEAACNRIRFRESVYGTWGFDSKMPYGRGLSMVFSGPPGTGKTMCAGIVADTLGTSLYRVELAAVVSKYIGETEKNLHAVFEAVKKGQGVLFFDEADVLFGRRTQVKNANDKHSNMEAAYLLQKIEEYEGVVILATNYVQNMDEAFKRRIQFFIEFPMPDKECRLRLWEKAFPEQTGMAETPDYAFLAERFELSGSHIRNIALQAAFFAAAEGTGVGMGHIIRALSAEVRKTGRRISREDLGEYGIYY